MAWPFTPFQTFTALVTVIGSAFLNAVQAAVNTLFGNKVSQIYEVWDWYFATKSNTNRTICEKGSWYYQTAGGGQLSITSFGGTTQSIGFILSSSSCDKTFLLSAYNYTKMVANGSIVVDFDFATVESAPPQTQISLGFGDATNNVGANFARFYYSNSGNWFGQTGVSGGGGTTSLDLGVAPSTTMQRLRIELHGASTSYGACAMFFINDVLCGTITTNLPNTTFGLLFSVSNDGAGHSTSGYLGPVRMKWNRWPVTSDF